MQKMTHSEIRGTLMLLGLMALVVVFAYFTKGGGRGESSEGDDRRAVDSIEMVSAATDAAKSDSLRNAHRTSAYEEASREGASREGASRAEASRKSGKKGATRRQRSSGKGFAPGKSPVDRPVE